MQPLKAHIHGFLAFTFPAQFAHAAFLAADRVFKAFVLVDWKHASVVIRSPPIKHANPPGRLNFIISPGHHGKLAIGGEAHKDK